MPWLEQYKGVPSLEIDRVEFTECIWIGRDISHAHIRYVPVRAELRQWIH